MPGKYDDLSEVLPSDAVDDIIGKPPSWIVRRGTIIIIIIIAVIFAGASFIKYPDIIKGKVLVEAIPVGEYLVVTRLPPETSHRIKAGQKAIIKFRNYDYTNYGYVSATVSTTEDGMDDGVIVQMNLDKGFVTSTGKLIPVHPALVGDVQIIGERQTLLHRLFFRE